MDQITIPDPVQFEICQLQRHIRSMEHALQRLQTQLKEQEEKAAQQDKSVREE
jgi:uncharacterized protein YukE